ncbi:MAG: ferrochelatase, partial [Proteobacteria bacterium]|nr:ferrochelatase [Pseudomonadota bacterium]
MNKKTGLLLVNLGTPESFEPKQVGTYLKEFLMDPLVIDIPTVFRWILVNLLIVPKRSYDSAQLYKKVWTSEGSPLLVHTLNLEKKVKIELGDRFEVIAAMRYGQPSIQKAIRSFKEKQITDILLLPLYPQYSLAATESSVQKVQELVQQEIPTAKLRVVSHFFSNEGYLNAVTEVTQRHLKEVSWDMVLFSFHGLPERQVKKTDPTGKQCVCSDTCCNFMTEANKNCYRAQSYATARALGERLALTPDKYRVGFQSRLKGAPWIRPFSDEFYRNLP